MEKLLSRFLHRIKSQTAVHPTAATQVGTSRHAQQPLRCFQLERNRRWRLTQIAAPPTFDLSTPGWDPPFMAGEGNVGLDQQRSLTLLAAPAGK